MPVSRLVLAGAVSAAALGLSACTQQPAATDTPSRTGVDPVVEPTIIRTPTLVDEAPATVPLPGVTGGPQGEPQTDVTFSPGPGGEVAPEGS